MGNRVRNQSMNEQINATIFLKVIVSVVECKRDDSAKNTQIKSLPDDEIALFIA